MPGMKITLDAAMRVRDVSRPRPEHEAAALAADALAGAARPGGTGPANRPDRATSTWPAGRSGPPRHRDPAPAATSTAATSTAASTTAAASGAAASTAAGPAPAGPAPAGPAAAAGSPADRGRRGTSDTGNQATGRAAGARGTGGKRHRSRKRFPR